MKQTKEKTTTTTKQYLPGYKTEMPNASEVLKREAHNP